MQEEHAQDTSRGTTALGFLIAVGLSAFLIFQVQPIMARFILPWFGGSAAVWSVCLVFFQAVLVLGYGYAHLLRSTLSVRRQGQLHAALLGGSLLLLPITPDASLKPTGTGDPSLEILLVLGTTVAIPYGLIAATGPLFQHWYAQLFPARSPYRLYALSNAGSLLGLLSYPFVFEPMLALGEQTWLWSIGYGAFFVMACLCAFNLRRQADPPQRHKAARPSPVWILWAILAATGSMLLVATTNQMCQDIAVTPFLWVVPLSLYLVSFIICFEREAWYDRRVWGALFILSVAATLYLQAQREDVDVIAQAVVYCGLLLTGAVVCHGELVRLKPPTEGLTAFYLVMSAGGALGGAFVSLAAPLLFVGYWELYLSILITTGALGAALWHSSAKWKHLIARYSARAAAVGTLLAICTVTNALMQDFLDDAVKTSRNFYGVLRIYHVGADTDDAYKSLVHGRIIHGAQFDHAPRRDAPIRYYAPSTGVGAAIENHPARGVRPMKVGVVGLGVGTLTAFGQPGDAYRVYEIDPAVIDAAQNDFQYLSRSQADVELLLGDARVSLERESPNGFDILAIDAFSGDAIPTHLLTLEALRLYTSHLSTEGVLALHITNRHVDLWPVVWALSQELGLEVLYTTTRRDPDTAVSATDWVLLSTNRKALAAPALSGRHNPPKASPKGVRWTDQRTDILTILR